MAPKRSAAHAPSSSASSPSAASTTTSPPRTRAKSSSANSTLSSSSAATDPQVILQNLWDSYARTTPQRVLLIDAFLAFLVVVGVLQFVYCVVAGNYPFNAFLAGFSATVGQFVLTASLRIQTNPANKAEFVTVSNERAFADYVFGSLLLHFFCVNFIN
ncbi:MAG: oligosaccharyltransferase complex subunit epsilon [Thelocarpon impressellum]|nr:MAG: oligosaccharyltransferase complex subunit epsilon [Thelocarpon impressellum]